MKVIGLTGGIGAGKSTVSDYLRARGFQILDADQMARDLTEKGTETLRDIVSAFGEEILFPDGSLNRKKLAAMVFSDEKQRVLLESLTTKRVVARIAHRLQQFAQEDTAGTIFVDAPLLFESGADRLTDVVWLVDAAQDVRISRVMARDGAAAEDVKRRIESQMTREEKAAKSAEIIDNSKGKEALYQQVERLLEKYVETE